MPKDCAFAALHARGQRLHHQDGPAAVEQTRAQCVAGSALELVDGERGHDGGLTRA